MPTESLAEFRTMTKVYPHIMAYPTPPSSKALGSSATRGNTLIGLGLEH